MEQHEEDPVQVAPLLVQLPLTSQLPPDLQVESMLALQHLSELPARGHLSLKHSALVAQIEPSSFLRRHPLPSRQ